eukprot:TRINITY_DN114447_c0_g1_i1.p1 TRINITY_DN114447_c0_g1~~TRINITY_DN114447_c0_g1_i1.p1  ORF type:complete len:203 (+),score=2.45 TRINITY_DN114447_c0_g1_i1:3-611(+)
MSVSSRSATMPSLPSFFCVLLAVVVVYTSTAAPRCNCPGPTGCQYGKNCTKGTYCCGGSTMDPSCLPRNSTKKCCTFYMASTVCNHTDTCCGGGGPGASSSAFCCKASTTCCQTTLPYEGYGTCCANGTTCCAAQNYVTCCKAGSTCCGSSVTALCCPPGGQCCRSADYQYWCCGAASKCGPKYGNCTKKHPTTPKVLELLP